MHTEQLSENKSVVVGAVRRELLEQGLSFELAPSFWVGAREHVGLRSVCLPSNTGEVS